MLNLARLGAYVSVHEPTNGRCSSKAASNVELTRQIGSACDLPDDYHRAHCE